MTPTITLVKEASAAAIAVSAVPADAVEEHQLAAYLSASGFEGKPGQHVTVPDGDGVRVLVGVGDADRGLDDFRTVGAVLSRAGAKFPLVAADVLSFGGEASPTEVAQAVAEGIVLGAYQYLEQKSEPQPTKLESVELIGKGGKRVQGALDTGAAVGAAACTARDLVNEPGGALTPPVFADKVVELGKEHGFSVTVLDRAAIEKAGMGGVLGVNRGSEIDPRFLELTWTPTGKPRGVVALVGKGVTFDSGGLSLKPTAGMLTMKCDMGGGAAVVGTFCGLAAVQPRVEVRGYVPLTDNMTGGDATRLGDVLTISNGKTVEIHNTDAEGRLILADGLVRASAGEPDAIIDLATLTGACMIALGRTHAGVFGNNQSWIDQILAASEPTGECTWQLPMYEPWRKALDSPVADLKNVGGSDAGASLAALFLREFVGDGIPWAHIDIAGPAFTDADTPMQPKGGTGYGVRLVLAALKGYRKPTG